MSDPVTPQELVRRWAAFAGGGETPPQSVEVGSGTAIDVEVEPTVAETTEPQESAAIVLAPAASLAPLMAKAVEYAKKSRAENTLDAYAKRWRHFEGWCARRGLVSLPASSAALIAYLTDRAAKVSVATMSQTLSAIAHYHNQAKLPAPHVDLEVQRVWQGIKNDKGVAATNKKDAMTPDLLRRLISTHTRWSLAAFRDRSVLLWSYAGAFRRHEVVDLDVEDVRRHERGLVALVRRSKRDQEGRGQVKAVTPNHRERLLCPVRAYDDWLAVSGITSGAIFRSVTDGELARRMQPRDVARVIKRLGKRAGIPEEQLMNLSGHSLRAGFVTAARKRGRSWQSITKQTGQTEAVAQGYVRDDDIFDDNAVEDIW